MSFGMVGEYSEKWKKKKQTKEKQYGTDGSNSKNKERNDTLRRSISKQNCYTITPSLVQFPQILIVPIRNAEIDPRRMAVLVARSQKATPPFFFQTWILGIVCSAFCIGVEAFDHENIRTQTND